MITRPLLAAKPDAENLSKLTFPVLATQKLDGIRCIKVGGKVLTRTFKEFPNRFVRSFLERVLPDGIDGEVMLNGTKTFQDVQSELMSYDGEPDFVFCAFDYVKESLDKPYHERVLDLKQFYDTMILKYIGTIMVNKTAASEKLDRRIKILIPVEINSLEELSKYESLCIEKGHEGVMIRKPDGKYKCGRATLKEGILTKIKQFVDSEARVIGFVEKLTNANPKEVNELGLTKRSHKQEGMVPANTLGAFQVVDVNTNVAFDIASGLTDALRKEIWENKEQYVNKIMTYTYQPVGIKDAPRCPVFKGFRSDLDL